MTTTSGNNNSITRVRSNLELLSATASALKQFESGGSDTAASSPPPSFGGGGVVAPSSSIARVSPAIASSSSSGYSIEGYNCPSSPEDGSVHNNIIIGSNSTTTPKSPPMFAPVPMLDRRLSSSSTFDASPRNESRSTSMVSLASPSSSSSLGSKVPSLPSFWLGGRPSTAAFAPRSEGNNSGSLSLSTPTTAANSAAEGATKFFDNSDNNNNNNQASEALELSGYDTDALRQGTTNGDLVQLLQQENAQLREQLGDKDTAIADLQSKVSQLEGKIRDLRQLPTGKISQIPIEDMLEIMSEYGSEISETAVPPRKGAVQKASVVRQFRRWNPNFFQHFVHRDGKWVPKLGRQGELDRRANARKDAALKNNK